MRMSQIFGSNVPSVAQYTDSNGVYTFTQIPAGRTFTVRAYDSSFRVYRAVTDNILAADGDMLTVDITLPVQATVRVTAHRADNTPVTNAYVYYRDTFYNYFRFAGYTNANGMLSIGGVQEGDFAVEVFDRNNVRLPGKHHRDDHGQRRTGRPST